VGSGGVGIVEMGAVCDEPCVMEEEEGRWWWRRVSHFMRVACVYVCMCVCVCVCACACVCVS